MTANTSGQTPEEPSAQTHNRSTAAGEQAYQRAQVAKLDEAVANGDVDPADLPEAPPPLSWT
ncbi:hypothetical protein GCM10010402_85870 [Actinomadura luteofluorescens]|uniref:hypothetical protein n=1 Tax=Actinomadura luteofluorescens TaxID=46163 RepID=UPI002164A369|nr:hypothetical protein [Actinomadura glauciflava]MCR3737934.1 hypothetical protein [Actinomadura glauciflava]